VTEASAVLPGAGSGGRAPDALARPTTILLGHFGSGKTEIAVNLAFAWRNRGAAVTLADLDLVKPYFRCRLAKEALEAREIRLVAPTGELFYADLPILVPGAAAAAGNGTGRRTILDVGGDDLGARVLGSLAGRIDRARADVLFVVNANRPFAENGAAMRAMLGEVQAAARLGVTGLVANTHLMDETTPDVVLRGVCAARDLEAATGIPVRFCAVMGPLVHAFGGPDGAVDALPILALERHIVPPFAAMPPGVRRRARVV
jgi:hypothetical protein